MTSTNFRNTLCSVRLIAALCAGLVAGCDCAPPTDDGGTSPAGTVTVAEVGTGFDIGLDDLERPMRSFQVHIRLSDTKAVRATPVGDVPRDIVEAGLGSPENEFTLVVADTRLLLMDEASWARIETEGPGSIQLSKALGIDADGTKVQLKVRSP